MSSVRVVPSRSALQRLRVTAPRFITITAPAGFGKTHLVEGLFGKANPVVCDARMADNLPRFVRSLASAAHGGKRDHRGVVIAGDAEEALFDAWRSGRGARPIVIDHAEALLAHPAAHDLVKRLLAVTHPARRIVVCGRRPVPMDDAAIALPHESATIGAADLALDRAGVRALLEPVGAAGQADAAWALSAGWPAAVLFLRACAQDGTLPRVLEDPAGPAAARFHAYVEREVFADASPAQREAAFACATSASVGVAEVDVLVSAGTAREGIAGLAALGLLEQRANGTCSLRPLLAATLRALHAQTVASFTARFARHFAHTAPLRAAPLLAAIGDVAAADLAYGRAPLDGLDQIDFESSTQAAAIDRETLLDNLALFVAASQADYYELDVDDWLVQAQEALRRAGDVPSETREAALILLVNRFALAGKWDEGHAFLASERTAAGDDAQTQARFLLLGAILDAAGDRPVDLAALRDRLGAALANGYFRGLFARRVASTVASLHGQSAETQRELEIAYERTQAHGRTAYALEIGMLACFEAWRSGDDDAVRRWYDRLVHASDHRTNAAAMLFLAALDGDAAADTVASETAATRAHACLIAASAEEDGTQAVRWIERALEAAERTRRPLTIVLAQVALALVDPRRAPAALRTASQLADATPSVELRRSVRAIANGAPDRGMLASFAERFSQVAMPHEPDLALRVVDGTVRWHDRDVALEERPFSALCALALAGRPLGQEELAEMLWPDRSAVEMANALRVHVSAIRRSLSKEAVVYERGRYHLRASLRVDLVVYESLVRGIDRRRVLRDADRAGLRAALQALDAYAVRDPHLELVLRITERVGALRSRIREILAGDALSHERYADALQHARIAQALDPYDDRSAQIVVTALWRAGRRAAAVRAFREHEERLRNELGVEPSLTLEGLVESA